MVAKLAILILAATATAGGLLSVRHQRLQAVYDTARAIEQSAKLDRQLWSVRIELAERLDPVALERMLAESEHDLGRFQTLFSDWCDTLPADVADDIRLRLLDDGRVDESDASLTIDPFAPSDARRVEGRTP